MFIFGLIMLSVGLFAQDVSISGKVVDESGESFPGVNVIEKGTTNGTSTDSNGAFSLTVPKGSTVSFSFLGYRTVERLIENEEVINIELLEDAITLDGTVVTALGISKAEKAVGYATQDVEGEEIVKGTPKNVGNMLTGRVSGLNVTNPTGMFQAPEISLRGEKPLIIVDNVPITTDLWEINAEEIEDINVLKGVTASALYGVRGRYGAILITTKGAKKEGLTVEFTTNTMMTAGFTAFPKVQTEYGNGSQGRYEFWDGADGGISDGDMVWGPKFSDNPVIAQWNSPIRDTETGETIEWYGDVKGTKYDDKSRYERVPIPYVYNNALKEFLRQGYVTSNNLAINHKGEFASHRFSANYSYQRGQVPNTSMHTANLSLNSTYQLLPNLELNTIFTYNNIYSPNYPRYGYGPKNHIYTILVWMGWDVNMQDLEDHQWVPGQEGYRQANFNYAWYNNPYFAAYNLTQEYDENLLKGKATLKWDILEGLNLRARVSATKTDRFEDRKSPKSYLNYGDPREGDYKTWNKDWLTSDNDILASYNKRINKNFAFTINAGAASFYHRFSNFYSATDGLVVPGVYSLNNTQNAVKASSYIQEKAVRGIYGIANTDLFNAFFIQLAIRKDWSSALPEQNSSYSYPSVSLSTVVSNLVEMPKTIDYLKVYGSWAEVHDDLAPATAGNPTKIEGRYDLWDDAGYGDPYRFNSYYSNVGAYNGATMLSYPSVIVNPNIKPEKSVSLEAGLATSLWLGRLTMEFTYYNTVVSNDIINLDLSPSTGFVGRLVNGNEYTTNGFEVQLTARPIQNNNFRWDIGINAAHSVTRFTEFYGGADRQGNYELNERVDNYYATGWMMSPDGKVILDKETGMPTKDPVKQNFGHLDPDLWYGLQNTFKYKKWTLNADFDGVIGGVMFSRTVSKNWWAGKTPESTEFRDEEFAAGEPVYVPEGVNIVSGELERDQYGNVISDTRVFEENTTKVSWQSWSQNYPYRAVVSYKDSEKFSNLFPKTFFKMRRLAISYDLSEFVKNSKAFSGIEATVFAYNVFIIKSAKAIDPDFGDDQDLQDPGARYIGLNVKFTF